MVLKFNDLSEQVTEAFPNMDLELPDGKIVSFKNIIRHSEERRNEVAAIEKEMSKASEKAREEGVDNLEKHGEYLKQILSKLTDDKAGVAKLFKLIGNDVAYLQFLYTSYYKETSAGEASGSQES